MSQVEIYLEKVRWVFGREFLMLSSLWMVFVVLLWRGSTFICSYLRDLLDLSKDNLQIKESKTQGIYISGATEVRMKNMAPSFHSIFLWYWERNTWHQDLHAFTLISGICSIIPADIHPEQFRCIRKPFCKSSWALFGVPFYKQVQNLAFTCLNYSKELPTELLGKHVSSFCQSRF